MSNIKIHKPIPTKSSTKFGYDAFGNVRTSQGVGVDSTGGDFRFQGQWLESATGLYNFRARDYDARTGTFLSCDPVDPNAQQPEALNPYQAMYNNPYIYSDPSGAFTLIELQSGFVTEQALNKVQMALANHARQYLIDKARGVATEIVTGVAQRMLSNLDTLSPVLGKAITTTLSESERNQLGGAWERILKGQFKEFIGGFFPQYLDSVWFAPQVLSSGEPKSNGLNLSRLELDKEGGKSLPNPDFIIKTDGGPESTDFAKGRGQESYWIGDFKFSWDRAESDMNNKNKDQFSSMMNYARFTNRHQVVPIALYVTMIGGKSPLSLHKITR